MLGQLRGDGGPAADATTELVAAMASRHGENLSDTASLAADVRDAARQGTRLID
ncbi:hypothetical protein GALL_316100 [mine drainage metagenome]|uniref:Uncharacterized protein n=1 Tax=mine drainage metagenome TaxID=410659 RepID=A0A1J5QSE1_9ZZZZ